MMYERAALPSAGSETTGHSHRKLLNAHTGHLSDIDIGYFTKWDRLVDLEADAGASLIARAWLIPSFDRENETGRCMSDMVFRGARAVGDDRDVGKSLIVFARSNETVGSRKTLDNLTFEKGCHVVVSLDCISLGSPFKGHRNIKRHMHIVRGFLHQLTETEATLIAGADDAMRLSSIIEKSNVSLPPEMHPGATFRLDRDDVATGVGTLRQNLIRLFTTDMQEEEQQRNVTCRLRMGRLRDSVVRLVVP